MTETDVWTVWPGEAASNLIITLLVVINIVLLCWAVMQRRRRTKLDRDIIAGKAFGTEVPFELNQPFTKSAETENVISEVGPVLKIDQAIKMIKSGYSLEETKSEIDIETTYLQIIAKHHHNT